MTRYPTYRALYKPVLFAGVPMMMFLVEILMVLLLLVSKLWLLIIPMAVIHVVIATMIKADPYFFMIFMDVLTLRTKRGEKDGN